MSSPVLIGDFLRRIKRPIELDSASLYKLVTIKLKHKGVVLRGEKLGADIKSKMYQVKEGDFILSGIDARNGAFGIVPPELDGAVVTNDFWYFEIDDKLVDKNFFLELTATHWFDDICRKGSDGTTQRIRLQKNKFFNQKIYLPDLTEQRVFNKRFQAIKASAKTLSSELIHQQILLKKLRLQILQEAIEGKLTIGWREQNPNIETASELLRRIADGKAQLIKDKRIKAQKPLPPLSNEGKSFELPTGWEWCRLGELTSKTGSGSTPKGGKLAYINDGYKFIRSQNVYNHGLVLNDIAYIPESTQIKMSGTQVLPNDLLLNITGGSIGRCAIVPENFDSGNINQHVAIIRLLEPQSVNYIHKVIISKYFQQLIMDAVTGAGREGLPKK